MNSILIDVLIDLFSPSSDSSGGEVVLFAAKRVTKLELYTKEPKDTRTDAPSKSK